jgi:Protein of unknown function (DUF3604)
MRRSICLTQPAAALAGAVSTIQFKYQTATALPKGTMLKFDLRTAGRDMDWECPRSTSKYATNVIYALGPAGKPIWPSEVETEQSMVPQFEFKLPEAIKAQETFTIVLGAPPKKDPSKGTRAQTVVQRRKEFGLYVDPKGKGEYGDPEVFTIDIKGNELKNIRLVGPSYVSKNKRFDITVRFEDAYGNLTCNAPEDTLIDLSYDKLRESLNWKLFVPETGFVILPNLYFFEAGVYRIRLVNQATKDEFFSAPIKCFASETPQVFWGLLHGESERFDSNESIESCLRYFRDDRTLNFYSTSNCDAADETSNEIWKLLQQNVATFNEEDRFTTFLGLQWKGEEGVRQLLFSKDTKGILRSEDSKSNSLQKVYGSHTPKDLLSIPCFTMAESCGYDFDDHVPDFERLVEIYNAWGSSECIAKEGNPYPIKAAGKKGVKERPKGSVQRALQRGCRLGFVAGGLDDRGAYSGLFEADQEQYSPGLTAIVAEKHSRDALLDALHRRSCYATTGDRIVAGFELAGSGMGQVLSTGDKQGLKVNRHLTGHVAGTDELTSVEIIRNGKVCYTADLDGSSAEFAWDDLSPIEDHLLDSEFGEHRFIYYYLRVTQKNGQMAWCSPIWIDHPE